jgi:hypothetical protein
MSSEFRCGRQSVAFQFYRSFGCLGTLASADNAVAGFNVPLTNGSTGVIARTKGKHGTMDGREANLIRCRHSLGLSIGLCLVALTVGPRAFSETSPTKVSVFPQRFELRGMHEGRQLVVTGEGQAGTADDLTRDATYRAEPAGIVAISTRGYVVPLGKGEAAITIQTHGCSETVQVVVRDFDESQPLSFPNDIVPLMTRHGCNAGGCHGKASGQNGFKLSLFGFDPAFDHAAIIKEARGRRIFPTVPEQSLLLTKATATAPHGGGKRLAVDGDAYRTLRRWIAQGAPWGSAESASVRSLQIVPGKRVLNRRQRQQIAVLASDAKGHVRDVTRQAQFQSNETVVAAVDEDGLVQTFDLAGEATIMARYQGQVAVFRATVPLGKPIDPYPEFPPANFIDSLVLAKWKTLGLAPSGLCSDSTFIRRVSLDIRGTLPTPDEVRAFLKDASPDKRSRFIDRCLEDESYAAHFAMRWSTILRNSYVRAELGSTRFHDWIRDMIGRNRPYDEFVRGIVTASGEPQESPAVNWLWQMRGNEMHQAAADTAQLFMGLRLQCARCHHHPYERWSQDDYYGLAGFFARLQRKGGFGDDEPQPYYSERQRTTNEVNPRTGKPIDPKLLDGPVLDVPPEDDARVALVDWLVKPDNPYFARALCNRVWGHLLGRGIVDPVDDMRETNPPSNPELLDALAKDFAEHHYDVKHLIRTIGNSRTYQLSSDTNEFNQHDVQNYARYFGKRLPAEVMLDAVDQVTGSKTRFNQMSKEARAVDLPNENFSSYFLDVFSRPQRTTACECGRSNEASLPQVLHLAVSGEIEEKVADGQGRVAKLVQTKAPLEQAINELYLAAFSRHPTAAESARALAHARKRNDPKRALEDLTWAILNTREFMYNH